MHLLNLKRLFGGNLRRGNLYHLALSCMLALWRVSAHLRLRDLKRLRLIKSWTASPREHSGGGHRPFPKVFLLHALVFELEAQMLTHLVGGELDLHFRNFYKFSRIVPGLKLDCFFLWILLIRPLLTQALAWR